jgi:XTP/dITP diphosphohydrolase
VTKLVLATGNAHKVQELQEILTAAGVDVELVALPADAPDVVEDELTFAGNALKKARAAAAFTGLPSVADDSGLAVDALNGMPGVFSARWAGKARDDLANLNLVLEQISDVPDEHRTGAFVCAAALVTPAGHEEVVEGLMAGRVISEPRGTNGFGYDPIFVPDEGNGRTTAEFSAEEKNAISHRGKAFRALVPVLMQHLG